MCLGAKAGREREEGVKRVSIMSDWDRFEHRDLGGAPGLPNIRHQRDHNPMLHAARGTNGDQAGIYKGSFLLLANSTRQR